MKKLLVIALLGFSFLIQNSYALDATGTIEEYKSCRTGTLWRLLLFKVDGHWFGLYESSYNDENNNVNDYVGVSMVMQAFASGYTVSVRATGPWGAEMSSCGNSTGSSLHTKHGDYIHVIKQ